VLLDFGGKTATYHAHEMHMGQSVGDKASAPSIKRAQAHNANARKASVVRLVTSNALA